MIKTLAFCLLAIFRFIVTTPGEDASTQVGVNWHSSEAGSYLELATSTKELDSKPKKYYPQEKLWHLDNLDSLFLIDRYVCKLNLNGLRPGQRYVFRIRSNNGVSETRSFMTPSKSKAPWCFIAFADFQTAFNKYTHPLIQKLRMESGGSSLALCSGDLTDYGSKEAEWSWLLENPSLKSILFSASPGDHEYWGVKPEGVRHIPMMKTPEAFNMIFNNPQNGCPSCLNSSYWYIYKNVLFIHLDYGDSNTTRSQMFNEEVEWFKKTVDSLSGKYQYLVVVGHKSMYGSYTTDSGVVKYMQPLFAGAFKEKHVNLVISGHDHMYSRTRSIDGTYYLDLGSSGHKARVPDEGLYKDGLHEKVIDFRTVWNRAGAVINVSKAGLNVTVIDFNGKILDSFSCK